MTGGRERSAGGSPWPGTPWSWLLVLAALFALRLALAEGLDRVVTVQKADLDAYDALARNLVAGHGYVLEPGGDAILWRAPLYAGLLAALWSVAGVDNLGALAAVQAFIDALSATVVFWLGRRLGGTAAGVLAALGFVAYPLSVYYTLRVMPEPLLGLGLALTAALMVRLDARPVPALAALAGVVLGLTALAKPVVQFLPLVIALWLVVIHRAERARALGAGVLLVACFAATVAPWTARNYLVAGEFLPIATIGGYSLWVGNRWDSGGREHHQLEGDTLEAYLRARDAVLAQAAADSGVPTSRTGNISVIDDRAFARAAREAMLADPLRAGAMLATKFFHYFWFDLYLPQNLWAQRYVALLQGLLVSLATVGVVLLVRARRTREALPVVLPILYVWLMHTLVIAGIRYSIPLVPLACVLAGVAVAALARRLAPGSIDPPPLAQR